MTPAPANSSRILLWSLVIAGVIASLVVSRQVAAQSILVGAPEGRWFYFYLSAFHLKFLGVSAIATALCLGLLRVFDAPGGWREWLSVFVWFVAALAIEGVICSLAPFPFDKIFASDGANSFNTVAQHFTPGTMLGDFEHVRTLWPPHGQSNMPGKSVFVYWLRHISRDIGVLPWLVLVVSNVGGLLLYGIVRDLLADRRAALFSLILYIVVPGKMFFFPLLNTVTPVTTLLSVWLLVRWLKTGHPGYAGGLGLSIYAMVLWEPLGLALGLLFAALMLASAQRGTLRVRMLASGVFTAAVCFGAAYAAMVRWFHFDLLSTVRLLAGDAIQFNVIAQRPYDIWVRQNLYDFVFGAGVCQAVLIIGAAIDGAVRGRGGAVSRLTEPIVVLSLGLVAVVAAIDWLGVNRGEVVRLWIFLACLSQVPAAYVCARLESRVALGLVLTATLLHDALGTAMIGFILPG